MTSKNLGGERSLYQRVTVGGAEPVAAQHYVGTDRARQEAFADSVADAALAARVNARTGAVSLAIPSAFPGT